LTIKNIIIIFKLENHYNYILSHILSNANIYIRKIIKF